ncbi:MAG TPA: hypothetical protein PLA83_00955 [Deltaproteobacteria bacterium]|nr:hypothetical protein [Deltaproteobacteria bacterium]HQI02004.1 hypothetical protein [Deltaproteobacteria bacterium]HQJ07834.1 hypothetical protein [Deltaproteobacteria bacterium]
MKINPVSRMIVKKNECGALIVTGRDKIKSGYGNGDCLLLNLKHSFFALSDSTERHSRASSDLLGRLSDEVGREGVPEGKKEWLDLVNRVFAVQKYQHKATFSLAAIRHSGTEASICIINGGDSAVTVVNKVTGRVEYATVPNMNFAGRSKGISGVMEVVLKGSEYRLVMASDGLSDVARFRGMDMAEMMKSFLSCEQVHRIPEKLGDMIRSADAKGVAGNYDDIGIIVVDPAHLAADCNAQIVMGGTSPIEEKAYQKNVNGSGSRGEWIPLKDLPEKIGHINMCGIRITN